MNGTDPTKAEFTNCFGRSCLDRVYERDVDLLLLEELICSRSFRDRISGIVLGEDSDANFLEASNSVSTAAAGESDLIALFEEGSSKVAVMLENKIDAPFMPSQARRYRRRGDEGRSGGYWDRFATVLVAPQVYLDGDHGEHKFDYYISYESLIPHFESDEFGLRGEWRAELLRRAVDGAKSGTWTRVVDETTTAFYHQYESFAASHFPELPIVRKRDRPPTNTWVQFRLSSSAPPSIRLWHKGRNGTADIQFDRTAASALEAKVRPLLDSDMYVDQTQKSAVIRIDVPELTMQQSFEEQAVAAKEGLTAVARLLELFETNIHLWREFGR